MTSDVVLSAAMRTNLLSLQGTQNSIDVTQRNLSTGKKINSALDGPQAFFASKALTNRAADLTKLLDSVGQSIQIIKAADNGITALTSLVEQADSIATQAQDALAAGTAEAKVTGNKDLRGIDDLSGMTGVGAGSTITLTATDKDGAAVTLSGGAITVSGQSSAEVVTQINEIRNTTDNSKVFEAKLNDKGQLEVKTVNGGNFRAVLTTTAGTPDSELALANALGLGDVARIAGDMTGAATQAVEFTAVANVALTSYTLAKDNTGTVADRSSTLASLYNANNIGGGLLFAADNAADDYLIGINGGTAQQVELNGQTIQGFIDSINNNSTLNTKIKAEFNDETGQLSLRAISADVKDIQIGVKSDATAATANFGFGTISMAGVASQNRIENISIGAAAGQLAKLEQDFNKVREQMDQLVKNGDTAYRGTNLLNGDNLLTAFNEDRSSTIETKGVTFTSEGLGIEEADFARADTVTEALNQVRDALASVREFGTTLANDLSVIQTRQTFINNTVNTLKEGSDKLVNADQNEEGAKLLALQTRQSLGVTALSLASQSQQSILRLF